MITLKGDGVSLTVEKSNPLYKNLSRFVGEVFVVESTEDTQPEKQEPQSTTAQPEKYYLQEETEAVDVQIPEYFELIKNMFPDEKSVVRSILTHHANRFFGATEHTKVGRYLAIADTLHQDTVVVARVIENRPVYVALPKGLVTRV